MKKIILLLPITLILFFLIIANKKDTNIINDYKYYDLEKAYIDYVYELFEGKDIYIDKVNEEISSDLAVSNPDKSKFSDQFSDDNMILRFSLIDSKNPVKYIYLEKNSNELSKYLGVDSDNFNMVASIDSKYINNHSDFISYIGSTINTDLIKNNKDTIDSYYSLLEILDEKGYMTLENCRDILDLKLKNYSPIDENDSMNTYRIYKDGNYTIVVLKDLVLNIVLTLNNFDYDMNLSYTSDFLDDISNTPVSISAKDAIISSPYNLDSSLYFKNFNDNKEEAYKLFETLYKLLFVI